ncbi:MAG: Ig-like domain-containing protein [Bacteroidaceae bacterium]|nr:Ig-like domain-containing protein [Bacteroidaceae bacterium]
MTHKTPTPYYTKGLAIAVVVALASCASIGSPDGGRYDVEPPRVVASHPLNGSVNQRSKKVDIRFNEFIKLENASEKVVISPPQREVPNVRADGKSVKITLYDSLRANTTYTIDFSDAIVDNNENNPMGQYTFSFSTGPVIDTMEVSGTVLNAENLEPVKGIQVGLYPADSTWHDSLFRSRGFLRVGRTDSRGHFVIKGVKPGNYRTYALQDMDGNSFFSQKSEVIAWDTAVITTSQRPDLRPDTVWIDTATIDKIRMVPYIHYFPDDIVLRSFLEEGQEQHLLKTARPDPYTFTLYFTAPQDSLPVITGMNFDARTALVPEPSLHNDTIIYWVTDTLVAQADTLAFTLTYPDTDTTGAAVPRTDTMELVPKKTYARIKKELQDQLDEWNKKEEKRKKKLGEAAFKAEEPPFLTTYLTMQIKGRSSLPPDPNRPIMMEFSEPVEEIDTTKLHLAMKVDSLYKPVPFLFLPVEKDQRRFRLYAEWEAKQSYRFTTDSLAFRSVMNHYTRSTKNTISIKSEDEYGSIFVKLTGAKDEQQVVQLLSTSDKVVAQETAKDGQADFYFLDPGQYYMRLFIDKNGNGKWDTGDYDSGRQPEEVFYFPQPLPLRARFDVEQTWNYRSIKLTEQKPQAITKQKPSGNKKSAIERNKEREQERQNKKKR